ncbi:MAG: dihydrolipoyl dehydrogenase [Candidatus Eremiobacterota bacterium]
MYDLTVLGGGPGGYVAAIRAAQLGSNVCLIEEREVGGTCLNRGCIPTKAILASADLYRHMVKAEEFGLKADNVTFNFSRIIERKNRVVENLRNGILKLIKDRKITLVKGRGILLNKNEIEVTGQETVKSNKIILATGSEPLIPGIFNSKKSITSDDALTMTEMPESIIIAGGGYLGCEWAVIFKTFGSDVTVVEMMKNIVPTEDIQISRFLQTFMQKQGIKIMTGAKILEVKDGEEIEAHIEGGKVIKAKKMLVSLGRKLNTRNLGFEGAGITFEREAVTVDETMRTSVEGIYAIGDITGKKLLAHVASAQALVAAENACGHKKTMIDYNLIPGCIYTSPEVASVGMTEQKATELGIKCIKSRFPFAANGKAGCIGETDGFVKIIAKEEDHKILGIHIIGARATELIGGAATIISQGLSAKEALKTVYPHPTLSESLMEALAGIEKECIHFGG